jgi:hypothetical protein
MAPLLVFGADRREREKECRGRFESALAIGVWRKNLRTHIEYEVIYWRRFLEPDS